MPLVPPSSLVPSIGTVLGSYLPILAPLVQGILQVQLRGQLYDCG